MKYRSALDSRCLAAALVFSGLACSSGSDSTSVAGAPSDAPDETPSDVPDETPSEAPVYVAFVGVPAPDGLTYYVTTLRALDGSTLSLDGAIEVPGDRGNRMYVNGTSVFVGEGESSVITRYDVLPGGELQPGPRMSLAPLGASPGNVNLFASDELSYLVDQWGPTGLQIIKWNPRTMETLGTLDIAAVASDDYVDFDVQSAVRWGKYFAIPYSLKNWESYELEPLSTVLLLDTETEETRVIRAPGCSYTTSAVVSDAGDLYLASSSFAYLFEQFDPSLPTHCVARVRAGALAVDETYALDLSRATGGGDAGDLAYTSGGEAYTLSFYPDATAPFDPADPFAVFDANAWRPWAVDLTTAAGRELDFPLASAALGIVTIDQRPHRLVGLADGSTDVYEVLGDGTTRLALSAPGSVYVLARIY